ncbi:hypothetical protein F5148DRAFT_532466 [Russula earlei]|uniref:Uncharacterized protein n=1 Tax=Russula earlei TaxID=71964 RepID=A0ACC0TYV1_9AGAM|nr:hypothetical protein F5148DRAFT_532466 [Russula earlei]
MSYNSPLKNYRLVALALCAAWGIISGSIGLNALIKSNQLQTRVRKLVPPGVTIQFHINDVYQSGLVVTTVCAVIALLAAIFLALTQFWPKQATKSLRIQAWLFTFFGLWLFATQIPYTVFVARHRAKVDAFLGGEQLPAQTVQAAISAAGLSDKYSKIHSAVLLAVFPWISLLFNVILIAVLLAAARRRASLEKASLPSLYEGEKAVSQA